MKLLLNKNYSRILLLLFLVSCQPQLPDRTKPPNSTSLNELTLPNISNFTLSNDIPVYLMEKHDVPIVQFILQINSGSFNDPKEKVGLSSKRQFSNKLFKDHVTENIAREYTDNLGRRP